MMDIKKGIILPLDNVDDLNKVTELVKSLSPVVQYFKIGLELINFILLSILHHQEQVTINNLKKIHELFEALKGKIMWDGKFNDIPNTSQRATFIISLMNDIKLFTIHASSGADAITAAAKEKKRLALLGVTVLTSITETECQAIFGTNPRQKVVSFAKMLLENGADGIICSPHELKILKEYHEFDTLLKVTPGVRPAGSDINDQKRVMTPCEAFENGATHIVVGRPITGALNPVEAAKKIMDEIKDFL